MDTEQWQDRDDGGVRIDQTIYVMKDSQKAIVLGKGGSRIKAIGERARHELEQLLERRVHLFLHVKTRGSWHEERQHYRMLWLDYDV